MDIKKNEILILLEKSLSNSLTDAEANRLDELLSLEGVVDILSKKEEEDTEKRMLKAIVSSVEKSKKKNINRIWLGAAASILLFSVVSLLFYDFDNEKIALIENKIETKKSKFNKNNVVLKLSDGSEILLDDTKEGMLANESGVAINRKEGHIEYDYTTASKIDDKITYNSIATPKGGKYQIVLADGTKVWLNAASELKFPTAFNGKERLVELSGEAYFEVSKSKKPFKVSVGETIVEVLGTHFNIMGYSEENQVETTLLEGSVNVINGSKNRLLIPGEKATSSKSTQKIEVDKVDIDLAVGWKEGLFTFNNTPIEQVMRQISRSYDIEVIYESEKPKAVFSGVIPKLDNISKALSLIADASGIKFIIEGNKIRVKK